MVPNLRGWKSGAKAAAIVDDMHHIFPKAGAFTRFFANNNINVNGVFVQINGFMHRFGLHGPGGGPYNELWAQFMKNNKALKNNPSFVIGFGFGLIDRAAPYLVL